MLQYSIYSVISPEGCASILWKDSSKANIAAEALSITSEKLLGHNLIDRIIPEPLGAAHRDYNAMYSSLKSNILEMIEEVKDTPLSELLEGVDLQKSHPMDNLKLAYLNDLISQSLSRSGV